MEIQEKADYFTELNDDCIFEVFKRLPILDLGTVSQTCTKLKDLAGDYIKRKHPELIPKSLTISMQNGVIDFDRQHNYIKTISKYVKTIEVVARRDTDICDGLIKFIQAHCGRDVEKIKLHGANWSEAFGEGIKDVLENSPIVEFYGSTDCYDNVLSKCQRVKYLKVNNRDYSQTKLPNKKYPTVEVFKFNFLQINAATWNDLAMFFQQNPNIKRFICCNTQETGMIKRLLTILVENSDIEEMFLELIRPGIDFSVLYREFKLLADRTNFKRLELKINCRSSGSSHTINDLASLQHFTGLHLENWNRSSNDSNERWPQVNVNRLINLKVLRLDNCGLDESAANAIAQHLVNLEQFHHRICHSPIPVKVFKPFVRFSKLLTEMAIICAKVEDNNKDIPKLNDERRKLADARKLNIFISDYSLGNFSDQLNGVDKDLVDIKTNTIRYGIYDIENENPLNDYELE